MKNLFTYLFLLLIAPQAIKAQVDTTSLMALYNMDIAQLRNVKVSIATKTKQTVEQAPSIVTVITAQEIKNMGARELTDVLQFVPGFEVSRTTGGAILMGVRGVKDPRFNCKLLLLEDGIPMNGVFYASSIYVGYRYNLENIERIEIIRGPGSPLYGRNAFSAIVNLITKKGKGNKSINAKAEVGSFNHYSGRLNYGISKYKMDFRISAYAVKTDVSDVTRIGTDDLWLRNHNNQVVDASFRYKGFSTKFTYANENMGNWEYSAELYRKTLNFLFEYKHKFNEKINLKARLYGQKIHHIEDYQLAQPVDSTGFLGQYVKPEYKDFMYAGEIETHIQLFEGNELFFGLQGDFRGAKEPWIHSNFNLGNGELYPGIAHDNQKKWEGGWVKDNGYENTNIAFYLQDIYYPIKPIGITVGARYDYEDNIGGVFNPRVGLVWNVIPTTYFKLLYGTAYRAPAGSQLYQLSGFSLGNPDLKPERIRTFEASITNSTKKMTNQINIFRNYLTDMIYAEKYITPNITKTAANRNMGENVATGIEFENKIVFSKNISSFVNYSYTVSENTDEFYDGTVLTYDHIDVAPHKLNAGVNIVFSKYYNFNTTLRYRSERKKFFTYNPLTTTYDEISEDKVGDYAILNSTFRIVGLIPGLEFSASVYNLLDTDYYSQEASQPHVPVQGRRQFIVRVGYGF